MHAANRAAWDEAAERYERWLDEAIVLIRSGAVNLFGAEVELIGDLHGHDDVIDRRLDSARRRRP